MNFRFPKTLLILIACLAFVSQVMASTMMSYHMMSNGCAGHAESQDMSMMDHSHHAMMAESVESEDTSANSCCASVCKCFTSGCSNFTVLMSGIHNSLTADELSLPIHSRSNLALSQPPSSLYRPPIFS